MNKVDPILTQNFVKDVESRAKGGIYRIELDIKNSHVPMDVYPGVFPPKSSYSASSKGVYENFGDLEGKEVLDIGSGTGIESIIAALLGARHVDATDVDPTAVSCTRHNVELNKLEDKISVFQSDVFSAVPHKKYDVIIANLPIVDFETRNDVSIIHALYDPDFKIHARLFSDAKNYLAQDGLITFTHANLQSANTSSPNKDFEIIEELIKKYGFSIYEKKEENELGYTWVNYKIKSVSK